jgi:single-strand DNA-binding protein
MLNKVLLIGTITKIDVKQTKSNLSIAEIYLKVVSRKNRADLETNDFMIAFFGKTAEDIGKINVGSEVYIEGKIRIDSYQKDGNSATNLKIVGLSYETLKEASQTSVSEPPKTENQEEIPF